ncbi:MAG: serine/threonine-protein phosphatase [Deltaproteobacteria bacterium]|nr:serine/threonine-protein phosphatase [Deltaproteobacteria bacterium]
MEIQSAARTHVGRRANNEDAFVHAPRLGLFAVADGMGGYEGGEVASRITVETLEGFVRRALTDHEATWPFGYDRALGLTENLLDVAVRLADAEVFQRRTGRLASMGSTVAALVLDGAQAIMAHVGDSRIYRLRGGVLEALTRDHSLYFDLQRSGYDLPPLEDFPHKNVITRAVGLRPGQRPPLRTEALLPGDTFLLCTDGLMDGVPDPELQRLLALPTASDAAEAMVEEAFAQGSRDNITVVVVKVA